MSKPIMEIVIKISKEDFNAIRYGHGLYLVGHDKLDDAVTEAFEQATVLPEASPTGDYVSRSDLVQAFKEECCGNCHLCERFAVFENGIHHCGLIDNAMSMHYSFLPQYQVDLQCAYDCGYEKGKQGRPKGEWIPVNPDCRGYPEYFKCSICGAHIYTSGAEKGLDYNGCPYCFADMRGDAE